MPALNKTRLRSASIPIKFVGFLLELPMSLSLRNASLLQTDSLIGGEWRAGARRFVVRNPATGLPLADVACSGAEEAEAAVAEAARAFETWRRYDAGRQNAARGELERIRGAAGLSGDVAEVVGKAVEQ